MQASCSRIQLPRLPAEEIDFILFEQGRTGQAVTRTAPHRLDDRFLRTITAQASIRVGNRTDHEVGKLEQFHLVRPYLLYSVDDAPAEIVLVVALAAPRVSLMSR